MALHRLSALVLMLFVLLPLGAAAQPRAKYRAKPAECRAVQRSNAQTGRARRSLRRSLCIPILLLSLMLMASTYPRSTGRSLGEGEQETQGRRIETEADKQTWDESVKSLAASPDVLAMMSSKLDWTMKR